MAKASQLAALVGAVAWACSSPSSPSMPASGGAAGSGTTQNNAGTTAQAGSNSGGTTNSGGSTMGGSSVGGTGAVGGSIETGGTTASEAGASPGDAGASSADAGGASNDSDSDVFGVHQLYPSKPGGRQWFMDRKDVLGDGVFQSAVKPTPNGDGSWHIVTLRPGEPNQGARMDVTTPAGVDKWLNVEMTGYVRLVSFSSEQEFAWRTTSGYPHTDPCNGYAYYGSLLFTGASAAFLKEVWHNNGYKTSPMRGTNPTTALKGRWIGLKMVRYNVDADSHVHLELWLDDKADGNWKKLVADTDTGWVVANPFPAGTTCLNPLTGKQKTLDTIMLWPYPLVTFRADNSEFDFDKLSVREITAPAP